jgi:hypothetical protein
MTAQRKLGDYSDSTELETTEDRGIRRTAIALREAPDNAEPNNPLSCPWCLASPDGFKVTTNDDVIGKYPKPDERLVSCGNCNACIPTEADWYLRGRKICLS